MRNPADIPLPFRHETIFGRPVKWFALRTDRLAFAGVPLALPYEARFGRAVQWLALRTNRLAFAGLRHGCADNARGDQTNWRASTSSPCKSIRMGNYLAVDNPARNSNGTCIRYKK